MTWGKKMVTKPAKVWILEEKTGKEWMKKKTPTLNSNILREDKHMQKKFCMRIANETLQYVCMCSCHWCCRLFNRVFFYLFKRQTLEPKRQPKHIHRKSLSENKIKANDDWDHIYKFAYLFYCRLYFVPFLLHCTNDGTRDKMWSKFAFCSMFVRSFSVSTNGMMICYQSYYH